MPCSVELSEKQDFITSGLDKSRVVTCFGEVLPDKNIGCNIAPIKLLIFGRLRRKL